jgi:hypothetical protein
MSSIARETRSAANMAQRGREKSRLLSVRLRKGNFGVKPDLDLVRISQMFAA